MRAGVPSVQTGGREAAGPTCRCVRGVHPRRPVTHPPALQISEARGGKPAFVKELESGTRGKPRRTECKAAADSGAGRPAAPRGGRYSACCRTGARRPGAHAACGVVLRNNIQYFSHVSPALYRPKNIGSICIPLGASERTAGAVPSGGSGADPFQAGIPTPGENSPGAAAGDPGAAAGDPGAAAGDPGAAAGDPGAAAGDPGAAAGDPGAAAGDPGAAAGDPGAAAGELWRAALP